MRTFFLLVMWLCQGGAQVSLPSGISDTRFPQSGAELPTDQVPLPAFLSFRGVRVRHQDP